MMCLYTLISGVIMRLWDAITKRADRIPQPALDYGAETWGDVKAVVAAVTRDSDEFSTVAEDDIRWMNTWHDWWRDRMSECDQMIDRIYHEFPWLLEEM